MKKNWAAILTAIFILQIILSFPVKAASGDPDPTFGNSGVVSWDGEAENMTVQTDNKIVVVGSIQSGSRRDFLVRRYTVNGAVDFGFSFGGRLYVESPGLAVISDVAMQSDGKIIVVGTADPGTGTGSDFWMARITANGWIDNTFGNNGFVTTDFSADDDVPYDVAVRADGKIVIGGTATFGNAVKFAVARYNPDGTLDTTFSGNGKMVAGWGENRNIATGVALLPNNKILLGGFARVNGQDNFALAQFNNNGSLDSSFGTGGLANTNFGVLSQASAVALQSNGKIIAAGYTNFDNGVIYNGTTADTALARYNASGSLDTTFGSGGKVLIHPTDGFYEYFPIICRLQTDGKIVIAGWGGSPSFVTGFVMRFTPSGALDTGFGSGGSTNDVEEGRGGGLQSSGKIISLGNFNMVRLLP